MAEPKAEKAKYKVSHNNCPEVVVEAADEREAKALGLQKLNVPADTPHPVRAWPVKE